jgi:hypothetical protein
LFDGVPRNLGSVSIAAFAPASNEGAKVVEGRRHDECVLYGHWNEWHRDNRIWLAVTRIKGEQLTAAATPEADEARDIPRHAVVRIEADYLLGAPHPEPSWFRRELTLTTVAVCQKSEVFGRQRFGCSAGEVVYSSPRSRRFLRPVIPAGRHACFF